MHCRRSIIDDGITSNSLPKLDQPETAQRYECPLLTVSTISFRYGRRLKKSQEVFRDSATESLFKHPDFDLRRHRD